MLSARIRFLRKEKKLTQDQLAKFLGIKRERYSHYETEATEPNNEILSSLADFYETTTDYLLGRTDDRENAVKIRSNAISSTPDLKKILLETSPTWNGIPLTEKQADMVIGVLENILETGKGYRRKSENKKKNNES